MLISLRRFTLFIFILLSQQLIPLVRATDLYEILGVSRTATDREIRSAYKKLSLKYHPDKNKDVPKEEAEKRFTEIANAYEALSDPERRKAYDQGGDAALKQFNQGGGAATNPFDLFRRFTGGQGGGGASGKKQKKAGPDVTSFLEMDLEELYSGTSVDIMVSHRVSCPKCGGSGAAKGGMTACPQCQGRGMYLKQQQTPFGILQMQQQCELCAGTGQVVGKRCSKCKGEATILQDEKIVVFVERGAKEGEELTYMDMGDTAADTDTGKLILVVHERPNDRFIRKQDDLYTNVTISLREALLGVVATITHLDGHKVTIDRSMRCTYHGYVQMVENEGMPIKDDTRFGVKGNLYVEFHVEFPPYITEEQRDMVEELFPEGAPAESSAAEKPTGKKLQSANSDDL
jgi:DnaJ-related protein SCJ1